MQNGIKIEKMAAGELVYLTLPLHPGSKLDKEPPTAPSDIRKQVGDNMGYPGVELTWKPGTDNKRRQAYTSPALTVQQMCSG